MFTLAFLSCCFILLLVVPFPPPFSVQGGGPFYIACRERLLGSKTLGLNVLELHFVILTNHDQNVLVLFRLAQSMFF